MDPNLSSNQSSQPESNESQELAPIKELAQINKLTRDEEKLKHNDIYNRYLKVHKLLVNSSPSANLTVWDVLSFSIINIGELRMLYPEEMTHLARVIGKLIADDTVTNYYKNAILPKQDE